MLSSVEKNIKQENVNLTLRSFKSWRQTTNTILPTFVWRNRCLGALRICCFTQMPVGVSWRSFCAFLGVPQTHRHGPETMSKLIWLQLRKHIFLKTKWLRAQIFLVVQNGCIPMTR